MNTNRLLVGLGVAIVIAILLSSFVYQQFKRASVSHTAASQSLVVAAMPLALGTTAGRFESASYLMAIGSTCGRDVHPD